MREGIDFCPSCHKTPFPAMRGGERVYICWTEGCENHSKVVGSQIRAVVVPENTGIVVSAK